MKVCWVLMRGVEQPLEVGHGDPVETHNELILYDADKNVIGRSRSDGPPGVVDNGCRRD